MKQFKLKSIIFLLLALLLPATATAYDFEVDGIYYNITSDNTVEVTYRDNNYASYFGSVDIPNNVTHNNVTYTVTAIGDYAFYDSEDVSNVSIPETVISIGEKAYYGCHPHTMTSWAIEAPTLNDSFDTELDIEYDFWLEWLNGRLKDDWSLLYVKPEAFDNYSNWAPFFNKIVTGEYTSSEIIESDVYVRYSQYDSHFLHAEIYVWGPGQIYIGGEENWDTFDGYIYIDGDLGVPSSYSFSVVAVEEGKFPSGEKTISYDFSMYPPGDDPELFPDTYFSTYSFIVDGIAYRQLGNNSVAVAPDVDLTVHHPFDEEDDYKDTDYFCHGLYNGHIKIPSTIEYEGKTYNVTCIDPYTFGNYGFYYEYEPEKGYISSNSKYIDYYIPGFCGEIEGRNLTSIVLPSSITSIDGAFYDCTNLERITLPNSVTNMEDDWYDWATFTGTTFTGCNNIKYFHLTGDGEWSGDSLNVSVQRLDIASGITAIPGLKVNPREVYSYAAVPPTCDENTFTDYTGTLHVPASSLASYFIAPYWCNFANIIGDAVELQDLSLNRDSVQMEVGSELQLTATATPANANPLNVTWLSSDTTVAVVENGLVIAKRAGECDITAFFLDKQAECHVKVNAVLPTSLTIDQESALMEVGQQLTLTATVLPENATNKTISWSTTDNGVATVDNNGVVTAIAEGECDIVAACGDLQAACHVQVLDKIVYITLDQHRAKLLPNHILTLTPTVTPEDVDLVVSSSNAEVAAARVMNGVVQVVGIREGSSWIKVNTADGKAFGDSCLVTVYTNIGDVDADGYVSISDVTSLIDYLLTGNSETINTANADIDMNGSVSISDVTALIDMLLSGTVISTEETFTVNGVTFDMVKVTGGTFMMGVTAEQPSDANSWEKPVHEVTLASYLIGKTEVTQELWLAVMGTNPSKHTGNLQKPVDNVNWNDCQEFISRLNEVTGKNFRMPTEAEWEYAARGGNKCNGYVYAGSDNIDDVGWVSSNAESTTHPVASLQPNELSLYDMSGNVDEWVADYWGNYSSAPQTNPTGPETGTDRVYRGGSWYGAASSSRVSYRYHRSPTFLRGTMGLRLAL